jgi:hypothetical protein
MTDFTYTGTLDDHPVTGRVSGGRITGNPFVAIRIRSLVDNEVNVGLGQWSGTATLDDDILARATVAAVIDRPRFDPPVETAVGDVPPGAVY